MTLIQRVTAFSAIVVVISVLATVIALVSRQWVASSSATASEVSELHNSVSLAMRGLGDLVLSEGSKASRDLLKNSISSVDSAFPALVKGNPKIGDAYKAWSDSKPEIEKLLNNKSVGPSDDASLIAYGALQDRFVAINALLSEEEDAAIAQSKQDSDRAFTLMVASLVLITVLASASSVYVVRSIQRRVGGDPRAVVLAVRAVVAGNLSEPLQVAPNDTTSIVAELQEMQSSLSELVGTIRSQAEAVAGVAEQLGSGSANLHDRTIETADILDRSASQTHALSSAANASAEMAKTASNMSLQASQLATQGGQVMGRVVQTMQEINESSQKIGDIISVIDGIAFQTNILALNAAVEAARAGEQGRGFAVVASEVRALAQRSAAAAREIKTLIVRSVESVEAGKDQVQHAGTTMTEIVAGVQQVTDLISKISGAAAQQSTSLSGLSQTIVSVDAMTRQNVQVVEDSSAATMGLMEQANKLLSVVSRFKT